MRRTLLFLALSSVLWLSACSGDPVATPPAPASPQGTVPIQASVGGTLSFGAVRVLIPAGSLTQDTLARLQVSDQPLLRPRSGGDSARSQDLELLGPGVILDLGSAHLQAPIQLELTLQDQHAGHDNLFWHVQAGQNRVGLPGTSDGTTLTGRLGTDPVPDQDSSRIELGVASWDALAARPAHVDWPSWNAYLFQDGQFQEIVCQGVLHGQPPSLGSKPLLFVHGLGSSIRDQQFADLAGFLVQQNGYTSVLGFEYDTLSDIGASGSKLNEAFQMFNSWSPGLRWDVVGHSMGCLVSRSCFEQRPALGIAAAGNRAVLMCGPHLGSPVANALEGSDTLQAVFQGLLSLTGSEFRNADVDCQPGPACQVTGTEPGFTELQVGSPFLQALNQTASNHPQFAYYSVAGNHRGPGMEALDFLLFGLDRYPDDGLVDVSSANTSLIQPVTASVEAADHFTILQNTGNSFAAVSQALQ